MESLLLDIPLEFGHRPAGKLILTSSAETLAGLATRAALKRRHGMDVQILSRRECLDIEPALEGWRSPIEGAAYSDRDDVGDAQLFARELCNHLAAHGQIKCIPNVEVKRLLRRQGRIVGVETSDTAIEADAVVICAGASAGALLRSVRLAVPIYPLKGYSVTAALGTRPPQVSLTDLDRRIVFAHLERRMRLAGFIDFVGNDASIDNRRIAELVRLGRSTLPDAAHFDGSLQEWAGLRPATPSGLPIVGRTRVRGLYLNVGHGGLGWTLACATAQELAEHLG
jgi:D-amino-acid dehydrogenase